MLLVTCWVSMRQALWFSIILCAQEDRADKADGGGGGRLQAASSYKQPQDISPQRDFQNPYKGFAVRTHSSQTGPVYLGLGALLITLSFMFTSILFPFAGSRVLFIFPDHFHQK